MAEAQAGVVGVLEGKVAVAARATPGASDTGRLRDEAPVATTAPLLHRTNAGREHLDGSEPPCPLMGQKRKNSP